MAAGDGATSRLPTYRRRLAAAAVASLALHLLLARGLALTQLGLDGPPAETGAVPRSQPRPRADFMIRVPKSRGPRPAHERPLAIAAARPAADRPDADRPAAVSATPDFAAEPAEQVKPSTAKATAPAPVRDTTLGPGTTAARVTTAEATPADARADAPADGPAVADAAATPTAIPRATAEAGVVAARWRPREVALLERLAAPATGRVDRAADGGDDPLPTVAPAARVAVDVGGRATAPPLVAVAPPAATADESRNASPSPAPAAARGTRGGAALAGPRRAGTASEPAGPADTAAAPDLSGLVPRTGADRNAAGGAVDPGGRGSARRPDRATVATAADAVAGGAVAAATAAADLAPAASGAAVAPGPRAVGRAGGTAADRAAAVRRPADAAAGAEGEDEAELSVAPAGVAIAGPRRDDDAPAAAPRPPERAAVAALPAETRVRDVAEAFARRGSDARRERRTDPRAARADAVVDRGLAFLARAQQPDGRWCLDRFSGSGAGDAPRLASDTAATGLALLSFLGAGHDHFDGPHRDTVRRGLEFLLSVQKPDGDLYLPAGHELSDACGWLYSHAIASIALCEAVGMTGDPLLRPAATRACGFIAASQHPELGGWRYAPGADADLSVSGWMLVALRSGALAGVETDPRSLEGVRRLLDAAARPGPPGRYAYDPRNPAQRADEMSGLCMTAVGTLMRLHTGTATDDPNVAAAARVLAARRPAWDPRSRDAYLWYCGSQVLVHTGGPEWDTWYAALIDTLAATQETAGPRAGSWDPLGPRPDRWGRTAGRIYVTALHLLALEVPDRRLPTYTARE